MKKLFRVVSSLLLACSLLLNMSTPVFASEDVKTETRMVSRDNMPEDVKALVANLISYYSGGYRADIISCLSDLKTISPEYYEIWNSVINYWDWIEEDMVDNIGVAPDGIQNPKKHAFIVLGFALNTDGTMKDELVGRLEVAKASAEKYPDSYVLVTGGVEKNGWTEGKRMRDWLKANGVAENRIIVEEKAPDTAGNATNSFDMLYKDYDVDTVSLISSQYHVKRGSILYYAESLLKAHELGVTPIKFIGEANAGWYRADLTSESMSQKASSLRSVARVPSKSITSSIMTGIKLTGKTEYAVGESLDLKAASINDKNIDLDVTKYTEFIGFDSQKVGKQTVAATFKQGGKALSASIEIMVKDATVPSDPELEEVLANIDAAITEAATLHANDYTAKAWQLFENALAQLKKVRAENPTKEQAVQALQAYKTAYDHYIKGITHKVVKVEAKAATSKSEGNIAYWYCEECDRYFSDEALTKEITKDKTVIAKTTSNNVATGDSVTMNGFVLTLLVSAGALIVLKKRSKVN